MDFTETPNVPTTTQVRDAAINGHLDTVKFLLSLPDSPNKGAVFPIISSVKHYGHVEVAKVLEKYCKRGIWSQICMKIGLT